MDKRFDGYDKSSRDFCDKIYVKCPRCSNRAIISRVEVVNAIHKEYLEKVICDSCGYLAKGNSLLRKAKWDLWLVTNCAGKPLWAYNENHLDYLEGYVSAFLRERSHLETGWRNKSIGSRLPQWIKDSNNRDKVLKSINKLRKML